jgi:ATP-dependent DNA helicase RecQ
MDPHAALRRHFGFESFRPGQSEAVSAALADRDVLVVMPTGSGKSLCYQLPALMRDDLTLVVSPLVSLMQDQVEALERLAPGSVALVNGQRPPAENRAALERALSGELRLLYIAPERFSSPGFAEQLARARVGLFVVDEAHCVSQWGHDFRPDYFRLADAARYLGARAIVALTATATPQVAGDVVHRLRLDDPARITTGFDRPNLSFGVAQCATRVDKHRRIAAALAEPGALPAIVYAGTRAGTDKLAVHLTKQLGEEVVAYHAGLDRESRATVQRRFMGGEVRVVVATNAFGMGIDKADVRTVCHETVPGSVEAFYQEAGRAGRDGAPARCLLFAEQRDKGLHVFFIQRSAIDDEVFARVAERLRARVVDGRYDLAMGELAAVAGVGEDQARAIVGHLARAGLVRPAPAAPDRAIGRLDGEWSGRALAACRASAGEAERVRWRQYRAVWTFVEGDVCRRRAILRHFGDRAEPAPVAGVPCCDVCDPSLVPDPPPASARGLAARAETGGDLDEAIVAVVEEAAPAVGRTRAVEILRGGRSKVIREHSYDGLRPYGAFAHLSGNQVLARVDELLESGTLRSTGGRFPKLQAA